jgi:hypothetical protein
MIHFVKLTDADQDPPCFLRKNPTAKKNTVQYTTPKYSQNIPTIKKFCTRNKFKGTQHTKTCKCDS